MYYFKTKIESTMFSNLLGNSYIDSSLYNTNSDSSSFSNKKVVLNGSNKLITDVQANFSQPDKTISNTKMI